MKTLKPRGSQRGVFLLEVLIAIVIFAIGILAMISMQAVSIAAQNDSQYRAEAEHLIDQLTSQIRLAVVHDTTTGNVDTTNFATFAHQATTDSNCAFSGAASSSTIVIGTASEAGWVRAVRGLDVSDNPVPGKGLPGVTAARVQILASTVTAGINQLRVTICWQGANDRASHSHSVVAYID
jgi:type IV pilus assembly protein PilV